MPRLPNRRLTDDGHGDGQTLHRGVQDKPACTFAVLSVGFEYEVLDHGHEHEQTEL